jgi:hypothetical protein
MLVGSTNQRNLLSGLGSVLNALSLPRTAFFRWVSEVFRLLRQFAMLITLTCFLCVFKLNAVGSGY